MDLDELDGFESGGLGGDLVLDVEVDTKLNDNDDFNVDNYEKNRLKKRRSRQSFQNSQQPAVESEGGSDLTTPRSQTSEHIDAPTSEPKATETTSNHHVAAEEPQKIISAQPREIDDQGTTARTKGRRSTVPLIQPRQNSEVAKSTARRPSVSEIKDSYRAWLQIVADNKLAKHDPFKLKLIDYMSDMCNDRDNMNNFQFAATSVDAGARIYARKVDAVHENTLRVLREITDKKIDPKKRKNDDTNSDDPENPENTENPVEDAQKTTVVKKKRKSTHVMTIEAEQRMMDKTRRTLVDPKLKYKFILNSMTNTDIGDLRKMTVSNDMSVNDSGVPSELAGLFEELVGNPVPSLTDPDFYAPTVAKRLANHTFNEFVKQYAEYERDFSSIFCPTFKRINLNTRRSAGVSLYQDPADGYIGLRVKGDESRLPQSSNIFKPPADGQLPSAEEPSQTSTILDDLAIAAPPLPEAQQVDDPPEPFDPPPESPECENIPPESPNPEHGDGCMLDDGAEGIAVDTPPMGPISPPPPTPQEPALFDTDLSKFDNFCDKLMDKTMFDTAVDMNVGELRLNQLSQCRSFKPSQDSEKPDVKPKTKSTKIPIDFDDDIPLAKLGCLPTKSTTKPRKSSASAKYSLSAQQIRKQVKDAKIQQTRSTDFDFDAFKSSFEKLYNFPDVGVDGPDDGPFDPSETQPAEFDVTQIGDSVLDGLDASKHVAFNISQADEFMDGVEPELEDIPLSPLPPGTPPPGGNDSLGSVMDLPPPPSQTPGRSAFGQSMLNKTACQTPRKIRQMVTNFKQIDAREVKGRMWNLIESDSLLPRKPRPKNCDGGRFYNNYRQETRRDNVKKFSDLFSSVPKELKKTRERDLSIPIMFNLLLHLANEKKLEIQPLGEGDLDIITLGDDDDIQLAIQEHISTSSRKTTKKAHRKKSSLQKSTSNSSTTSSTTTTANTLNEQRPSNQKA